MSIDEIAWGFGTRFGQGLLEAGLTLLVGVVVAGVFRRMVGSAGVRRLFGGGLRGLFRGWLVGMLLPVCSIGVIPVAREFRRAGVPGGTVLAFALTAPLLNPISFLYGLTLAEPSVILCFAGLSLLTATLAGLLWERVFTAENATEPPADEALPEQGPKRLAAVAVTAARELTGPAVPFYLIGLTGSALLAACLPYGYLQNTMGHADPTSPALMAAIAVPVYAAPLSGMMKLGLMFDHGNSIGAAFLLFALGLGANLGLLAWVGVNFGAGRTAAWFVALAVALLGAAYVLEPALYDSRKQEVLHTHAFDDYTNPFSRGSAGGRRGMAVKELEKKSGLLEQFSLAALAALAVGGVAVRLADRRGSVEAWLTRRGPSSGVSADAPWWNRPIPGPVIGAVALAGLVAASVIGAYVFYPPPDQVFDRMTALRAEVFSAISAGKTDEAARQIELWDTQARKLQVGVTIREFGLPEGAADATEELRESLETVRDLLLAGDAKAAKLSFKKAMAAYDRVKDAYGRD